MFQSDALSDDKPTAYAELARQVRSLMRGEPDTVANAANFSALVFHALPEISWAGFYFVRGGELVVGPFQGRPACIRIALGKGVCGAAAASREPQLVVDVQAFPGHIFCDPSARAEVVVPLVRSDGKVLGVWDVDSARTGRFDADDLAGMQALCREFMAAVEAGA